MLERGSSGSKQINNMNQQSNEDQRTKTSKGDNRKWNRNSRSSNQKPYESDNKSRSYGNQDRNRRNSNNEIVNACVSQEEEVISFRSNQPVRPVRYMSCMCFVLAYVTFSFIFIQVGKEISHATFFSINLFHLYF